jgi:hypothetical protein
VLRLGDGAVLDETMQVDLNPARRFVMSPDERK